HTCTLDQGGQTSGVWCWGRSSEGQIGVLIGPFDEPRHIMTTLFDYLAVAPFHNCAAKNFGEIYCWGFNGGGAVAQPIATQQTVVPQLVTIPTMPSMPTIDSIAAGGYYDAIAAEEGCMAGTCRGHSCAVVDSELWCWGDNAFGQLGALPTSLLETDTPRRVTRNALVDVVEVCAGAAFTCARGHDNAGVEKVYCGGDSSHGQLGLHPDDVAATSLPRLLTVSEGNVHCGANTVCVPRGAGNERRLYCWG